MCKPDWQTASLELGTKLCNGPIAFAPSRRRDCTEQANSRLGAKATVQNITISYQLGGAVGCSGRRPNADHSLSCSSKRRKFVADGVFYAELNEFFQRELAEEGYSGVEVRVTPTVTDIIIRATHTQEVLGEQGRRIRELTSLIQKRFKFPENSVSLYAAKVQNRGLSAVAQCESLRYKLLNGLAVRRACYGVLRFIMESGAKGCEVVVSGKLRAARAKSMKFTDGFMIHSGQPAKDFIDSATRHVLLRQGVLGIKVKIMRGSDPEGKAGPQKSLPDAVTIIQPKEEQTVIQPVSQDYGAKAAQVQSSQDARVQEAEETAADEEPEQ